MLMLLSKKLFDKIIMGKNYGKKLFGGCNKMCVPTLAKLGARHGELWCTPPASI